MRNLFLLVISLTLFTLHSFAQTDSSSVNKPAQHVYTHYDSVYTAKLNSSGNLMITGGVGLFGVGGYLIYEGYEVYTATPSSTSTNPADDTDRNHRQGTAYLAAAGVGIAGGIVLIAFGARNKVDFKMRKKMMQLQSGILDNGRLGLALGF